MKYFLLTILIAVTGCVQQEEFSEEYNVYISPEFNQNIDYVVQSTDKWNQAVGVKFNTTIVCPHDCDSPDTICILPASENELVMLNGEKGLNGLPLLGLTAPGPHATSTIRISSDILTPQVNSEDEYYRQVTLESATLHEMGHALGLVHDTHRGTIMYPINTDGIISPACRDKKQYFNLRNMDYYCE